MPRLSVVVPIYNVEPYLPACLRSLGAQTAGDLEVIMVDDGSGDRSAEIAAGFAQRDPRFRLITQANAGLGHARNTGAAASTGELLAFVDSDDVVPHDAYERLAGALDHSGSDFASGNVQRLTGTRVTQAPFLARTFATTRLHTHVTRFRPLLADRIACNKLWRRSFWEDNGLRFPEGVLHEDIPVTLPAHVMAGAVDVLAETVYRYRIRGGGERSITQRRLELRVLQDRLSAVEHVRAYLAEHGPRKLRRWYDARIVGDDLRLHLDLLADADDAYREVFLTRVNALLDDAGTRPFAHLSSIDRLKWHLVRRGLVDELLEVLRFQRERRAGTPPIRRLGRWYGDYPFRDGGLDIPRSTFRLGRPDAELSLRATVEELRAQDGRLVVRGHAHIDGLEVAAPGAQTVRILAARPGRLPRLRVRLTRARAVATAVERPELGPGGQGAAGDADRSWSGFAAALPVDALAGPGGRWSTGTWQLYIHVRAGGVGRRLVRFTVADAVAVELPAAPALSVRAVPRTTGRVEIEVRDRWAIARDPRLVDGDVLELSGTLRLGADGGARPAPVLEARRESDGALVRQPLTLVGDGAGGSFWTRLALSDLLLAETDRPAEDDDWGLAVVDGARRMALALADEPPAPRWRSSGRELALVRTATGAASIRAHDVRPLITAARWSDAGALAVDVRLPAAAAARDLVLVDWHRDHEAAFALEPAGGDDDEILRATIPARALVAVAGAAGATTPRRGAWAFYGRPRDSAARAAMARVRLDVDVLDALPATATVDARPFTLAAAPDGGALLSVPPRPSTAAPAPARGAGAWASASASAAASGG